MYNTPSPLTIPTNSGHVRLSYDSHLKHLLTLAAGAELAAHRHYQTLGLQYCSVPFLVGITGACEHVDTLFPVANKRGVPMFGTQTGQLMLEFALQYYPGAYTIIHSVRDEGAEDERHLLEFDLIEEEFSWGLVEGDQSFDELRMLNHLLARIESSVKAITGAVLANCGDVLEREYGRNVAELTDVLRYPFLRVAYDQAVELLAAAGYSSLHWGDDLRAEHEAVVVAEVNRLERDRLHGTTTGDRPVFVTQYPAHIKFFNMKPQADDSRVVLSADLLLPTAGEAAGSAVRMHDGGELKERLLGSTMFRLHQARGGTYDQFRWYVDQMIGAKRTPIHAGYGLGVPRLLQWITSSLDIRYCSPYSMMRLFTGDFAEAGTVAETVQQPAAEVVA